MEIGCRAVSKQNFAKFQLRVWEKCTSAVDRCSLLAESGAEERDAPGDHVVAHVVEDVDPAIGDFDAGIDGIEVEQADAETGRESGEGDAGKHEEGVESWIGARHSVRKMLL